ncbi:MAG: hypothetical protein WCV90_06290 [Candidatus Woesearchaeota archaeon]|jgi:hypothetical protein
MYLPKRYGESKLDTCPFCGKQATTRNEQEIPVCEKHRAALMNEMKCACGEYLETCIGKWGLYFRCARCGNVNKRKVFEMNQVKDVSQIDFDKPSLETKEQPKKSYFSEITEKKERKEITITSRDTDWCD